MPDPGWLYQKLFVGPEDPDRAADRVLIEHVGPLSGDLTARGWIDGFFFLRYSEGGYHLRYRVRLTGAAHPSTVRAHLQKGPEQVRSEFARYEPEIEKYGGPAGLAVCERAFCASSRLAVSCLDRTRERPNLRLLVAAGAFDTLLSAAGLSGSARTAFLDGYGAYWSAVLRDLRGGTAPGRPDPVPMAGRAGVARRLDAAGGADGIVGPEFPSWSDSVRRHVAALRALAQGGRLTMPLGPVLANLAHTTNNRLGMTLSDEVLISHLLRPADAARA